jgi:hypothetical protein
MSYMKQLFCEIEDYPCNVFLKQVVRIQIAEHIEGKRSFLNLCRTAKEIVLRWERENTPSMEMELEQEGRGYADEIDE